MSKNLGCHQHKHFVGFGIFPSRNSIAEKMGWLLEDLAACYCVRDDGFGGVGIWENGLLYIWDGYLVIFLKKLVRVVLGLMCYE